MKTKQPTHWTTDQHHCIDMLAEFAGGKHHLPKVYEWGDGVCINWGQGLSTYDFDRLTRLVLLAHRYAIRVDIGSSGPGMVRIICHRRAWLRQFDRTLSTHHPNLADLAYQAGLQMANLQERKATV